ncbi:unnamed protein product [Strongylus vulgaris]|uniref:Uncharacterized protein n=1 Tax=Strongylus vulgaris TaxID=40348 RepID=A0A3P7IYZ5_STRVU|nr:unnamed protein product [Strongylus vulgaris]
MTKKQHRRLSCYKIMISLGVYDMAAIAINSLVTGYLWIKGANYCTNPTTIYAIGTIGLGQFRIFLISVLQLSTYHQQFIGGSNNVSTLLPIWSCFAATLQICNSLIVGSEIRELTVRRSLKPSVPLYIVIKKFQFFIQCTSICAANLIAALIYVYMQFFSTSSYFVLIGHICWQLGHGKKEFSIL